jgi:hypothetical protein
VTADDRYLHDSILIPKLQVVAGYKPVMPSYQDHIGEEQVQELVAYIKSLGPRNGREDPRLPQTGNNPVETKEQQKNAKERMQQNQTLPAGGGQP